MSGSNYPIYIYIYIYTPTPFVPTDSVFSGSPDPSTPVPNSPLIAIQTKKVPASQRKITHPLFSFLDNPPPLTPLRGGMLGPYLRGTLTPAPPDHLAPPGEGDGSASILEPLNCNHNKPGEGIHSLPRTNN